MWNWTGDEEMELKKKEIWTEKEKEVDENEGGKSSVKIDRYWKETASYKQS